MIGGAAFGGVEVGTDVGGESTKVGVKTTLLSATRAVG